MDEFLKMLSVVEKFAKNKDAVFLCKFYLFSNFSFGFCIKKLYTLNRLFLGFIRTKQEMQIIRIKYKLSRLTQKIKTRIRIFVRVRS